MANPSRFSSGISTQSKSHPRGLYPNPDPAKLHEYFNDFDVYLASDWTRSLNGGSGTTALVAGAGGQLVTTNSAGATDMVQHQTAVATFDSVAAKDLWFGCRVKTDSATLSTILLGLYTVKTTAATTAPTDGFWFKKTAAAAAIDLIDSTGSTLTATSTGASFVADTFTNLSFHFVTSGNVNELRGFVDGVQVCSRTISTLPTGNLALSFVQMNSSAVARTMTLDWLFAAQER